MKKYGKNLLICTLLVSLSLISGTSLFSIVASPFIALVLGLWLLNLGIIVRKKEGRGKEQALNIVILAATAALLGGIHQYQAATARQEANAALARILEYRSQRGMYPKRLADVGLSETELRRNVGLIYGLVPDDRPLLVYPSMPHSFDKSFYDFASNQWQFRAD